MPNLVPTYHQMMVALLAWLKKTDVESEAGQNILAAKLADDMFPLSTQIRFCCVQVYEGIARLRGEELPEIWQTLMTEGQRGHEDPGSMHMAMSRIEDAIAYAKLHCQEPIEQPGDMSIEFQLPNGIVFEMTKSQYVRDFAIPQFYFHLMASYCLLRQCGVDLGKADYIQHALGYIRE